MPTWGLTSAIAMAHSPSEEFPRIRVFGSVGHVASGVCSLVAVHLMHLQFDGTNLPFYCGAGIGFVAVLFNLTLPDTPPAGKGKKSSLIDAFGLGTVRLMKDRNFSLFYSFLISFPDPICYVFFIFLRVPAEYKNRVYNCNNQLGNSGRNGIYAACLSCN